jgi:hypothetical protein
LSAHPTPHLEKLSATLVNEKLPEKDKPRVQRAIENHQAWLDDLGKVTGEPKEVLKELVRLLNEYRNSIDIGLTFDSEENFLYRQKGQLKLDNSVIEEFLPRLITPTIIPELQDMQLKVGPASSFSSVFFSSSLDSPQVGGGLKIRKKDQDFSVSKPLYLKASHQATFEESITEATFITYVAAECKTNLDKTMFQEACATAHDTKTAVSGARYYLLCEWLDMTPQSTSPTDIDEIIILRKAKRLSSNVRKNFSTYAGRQKYRDQYIKYLIDNPFRVEMFQRFITHISDLIKNEAPVERNVLEQGYF